MNENEFWRSTPDKLVRLSKIHYEINNPKNNKTNDIKHNEKGEIITRGERQTFKKI